MSDIIKELSRIQRSLKAPKSQWNGFGKYSYRSCEDILLAAKPLLNDAVIILSDEIISVADRIYVKATATFKIGDQTISATGIAREPMIKKGMDESQITGSASSYARKIAIGGLLAIDDNKDADSNESGDSVNSITDEQITRICELIESTKSDMSLFLKAFSISEIGQLSNANYKVAISKLEKKMRQSNENN